ncbi:NAD(P)-dependent oxidoreductase [Deinococcus sp. KNUC1210]|uniref:NAD(P)-dependent oxidoreductase n=1 Tax=Deinococcus sp. KNUC1210 TaxID=2917691 RepID=UPI001EEFE7C3|nr:NAD(P)-dependent oxidoreductase [Deinococcus sp. KNUC1210]ULH16758.1 NAD(P)-dependent oxidoreductase [Deinococcus sp. KNUC1210]
MTESVSLGAVSSGHRAAFLGLGAMGTPMAAHLTALLPTLVWNRTAAKAEQHAADYGTQAATLSEVAQADFILTCLPTSAEVDSLIDQLLPDLKSGSVWIDCTSGHPDAARRQAAQLATRGVAFLDAPVSGGPLGAKAGTLSVMVGGAASVIERVRPLLETFGGTVLRVGDVGSGFAVKAINNTLMGLHLLSLAEGLAVLKLQGVDLQPALDILNASSGRSFSSEAKFTQHVLNRKFAANFALGLLAKDAGIALENVQAVKGSAPLLAQTAMLLRAAQHTVGSEIDHTAAVQMVEAWNNVELS